MGHTVNNRLFCQFLKILSLSTNSRWLERIRQAGKPATSPKSFSFWTNTPSVSRARLTMSVPSKCNRFVSRCPLLEDWLAHRGFRPSLHYQWFEEPHGRGCRHRHYLQGGWDHEGLLGRPFCICCCSSCCCGCCSCRRGC